VSGLLSHVEIVAATSEHLPWIRATFAHQLRSVPMTTHRQADALAGALERILRGKLGKAAVACPAGARDVGMGWAVSLDGSLVFAYVTEEFRKQRLGSTLATTVAPMLPLCLAIWTRDAEAIANKGKPIVYSIHAYRALCSYVRRQPERQDHQQRKTA
jgi:hypothetical protein